MLRDAKAFIVKSLCYPREYFVFRETLRDICEIKVKVLGEDPNTLIVFVLSPKSARLTEQEEDLVKRCYLYDQELERNYEATNPKP